MATSLFCDGVRRRDFLRLGVVGGTGLSLASYLRAAESGALTKGKATAAIHINLGGGPSHIDSFDMKPDSPSAYRGEFNPIETNVPGITFCEHLPKLARCADKFAILRGVSHSLAAHEFGTKYMNTGNRPLPSLLFPGYGAVVSKEVPCDPDLPPFVAIPDTPQVAGYLGVEYAPFKTQSTPRAGKSFSVRGISLARGLTVEEIEKRRDLLNNLDTVFANFESSDLVNGLDKFSQRAYEIISSPRSRQAFDISKESPSIAGLFPDRPFAQSCLLATRLVEAGVRFVSVGLGGWDTHRNNWESLKTRLLPDLDGGLSGLLQALERKGLLETTAIFVSGEFGRTPKINTERGGRDHYPRAMFVLLAGGGMKGGQVIGASDDKAMGPASGDGIKPDDVAATFYTALGIDIHKEYQTTTGRPVMIVREGTVVPGLLA